MIKKKNKKMTMMMGVAVVMVVTYTEWAKKTSGCIAGCNFVNYGLI